MFPSFLSPAAGDDSEKGLISGKIWRSPSQSTADDDSDLESQTIIQKGASLASSGFGFIAESARNVVTGAQQRLDDSAVTLSPERLTYFGVSVAVGMFFMFAAFLFFPMVVLYPHKFALLFTAGSLCIIASLVFLRGSKTFLAHFTSWERLPFSTAYAASLLITLYVTLGIKSYILALIFSVVQMVSLASLLASYIPGGVRAIHFMKDMSWSFAKRVCQLSS